MSEGHLMVSPSLLLQGLGDVSFSDCEFCLRMVLLCPSMICHFKAIHDFLVYFDGDA